MQWCNVVRGGISKEFLAAVILQPDLFRHQRDAVILEAWTGSYLEQLFFFWHVLNACYHFQINCDWKVWIILSWFQVKQNSSHWDTVDWLVKWKILLIRNFKQWWSTISPISTNRIIDIGVVSNIFWFAFY